MVIAPFTLRQDYWEDFELREDDIEFLYNHLMEVEAPLSPGELVDALVKERIRSEKTAIEQQRSSEGILYQPKGTYQAEQDLVFPALGWKKGRVLAVRPGNNPDLGNFHVIQVGFDGGEQREFASALQEHILNQPPKIAEDDASLDPATVLLEYSDELVERLEEDLKTHPDFVHIAGRWFPKALLVDVNAGHLNLAEAVLDMNNGGPMPTRDLIDQIGMGGEANQKLLEFSVDLALQEDARFDEVGAAGKILWFLNRLEPPEVLEPPAHLRYPGIDYDRSKLTKEMLHLERELDDELSPIDGRQPSSEGVEVRLIYPHWRSGTLPLSSRLRNLFPTAYEAPRIQFTLVDGESGERFSGWVVREKRYVYGLKEWYEKRGVFPGSLIRVLKGKAPGEVIVRTDGRRSAREWIRTVLVGSDGGLVFAMLKQVVSTSFDERMAIAVPDAEAVDQVWNRMQKERVSFERIVTGVQRELAKLTPQSHVHASELYAAVNVVRRCPPGPLLSFLATHPNFAHVGDMHFRLTDGE